MSAESDLQTLPGRLNILEPFSLTSWEVCLQAVNGMLNLETNMAMGDVSSKWSIIATVYSREPFYTRAG